MTQLELVRWSEIHIFFADLINVIGPTLFVQYISVIKWFNYWLFAHINMVAD